MALRERVAHRTFAKVPSRVMGGRRRGEQKTEERSGGAAECVRVSGVLYSYREFMVMVPSTRYNKLIGECHLSCCCWGFGLS